MVKQTDHKINAKMNSKVYCKFKEHLTKRQAGHRDIKDNRETSKESEQDVQI